MSHEMRRKDRELAGPEARMLLERGEYGILSTCGADGQPYGIPLNYCLLNDAIYFHCAVVGHKLDNITANNRVSFCVVGETEVLPEQFATRYESVVVSGKASEVFDGEKQLALEGLLAKYSAPFRTKGLNYINAKGERTRVFRIALDAIHGKARR
ncbi:MAG: pyridoxamine 5'-phosphate oxidase family protein [Desulfuromonadales bacterium]|nr:pyridoxamine 5'-phosphate oxidase family protein [Desulfuromonadales bacterium]